MQNIKGFSLIEILIALSVLAILSAIAAPNFKSWVDNQKASAAVSEIVSALESARVYAVEKGTMVKFTFNIDGEDGTDNGYCIFIDKNSNDDFDIATDQLITKKEFHGVELNHSGITQETLRFYSDSTAFGGTIPVKYPCGREKRIIVSRFRTRISL